MGRAITEEERRAIEERAYQLFLARGQEAGHDLEDWFEAEAEIWREQAPMADPGEDIAGQTVWSNAPAKPAVRANGRRAARERTS